MVAVSVPDKFWHVRGVFGGFFRGLSAGYLWFMRGVFAVYPRDLCGLSAGFLRFIRGIFVVYPRDFCRITS